MDVPGPAVDRPAGIAAENSLHVVIGVVERDRGDAVLHGVVLLARGLPGQAPEAHADGGGADCLGVRRWLDNLAGPARDGEEILLAEIGLDEIARGKFDFDVAGHYARPDVFRLVVDEAPKRPVSPTH